jgi:ADP-ribose pyrophosphatase
LTKKVAEGKRLVLLENEGWEYAERKKGQEAVAVIAVADGRAILTEQLRRPVGKSVIDWPAGLVGDEDPQAGPEETAKKELEEETGYTCESVELLARGPTSPGITSEIVSFYRARGVRPVGEGGGVGGESIRVHAIPVFDLPTWLAQQEKEGKLVDVKIWGGLYFLA